MNHPAAPIGGIAASLGQETGHQSEDFKGLKGRGIKSLSAAGELKIVAGTTTCPFAGCRVCCLLSNPKG